MKHILATAGLIATIAMTSMAALARDNYNDYDYHQFEDKARVTHVEPIYSIVRVASPQRECRKNYRRGVNKYNDSYTSTIAGGIIGGVLGNQFGKGSGKKVMTVAGTLLGGSIGRDYNSQSQASSYYANKSCHTTQRYHQQKQLDGYRVTYRYQGQKYTSVMEQHPGKFIPVEISVRPLGHYY